MIARLLPALALLPLLLAARVLHAQLPTSASTADTVSRDTMFFAEGLAADRRSGTLYVTSIHHRNVLVLASGAAPRLLLSTAASADVGAVLGAAYDSTAGALWLTTARLPTMASRGPGDSAVRAELLLVDALTGQLRRRLVLGAGDGMPGEIAIAPDGAVLVSDGLHGLLYRLRPGAASLEIVRSAALRSPQGIAVRPDGAVAYVADWSRGILRWDLVTDSVVPVPTADGRLLRGVDGLRWHAGTLLGVQNGATPNRVVRVALDPEGTRLATLDVLDAPDPLEGEMTVGVVVDGAFVYVASSAWPFWTETGARRTEARPLPPVVLRRVPLP